MRWVILCLLCAGCGSVTDTRNFYDGQALCVAHSALEEGKALLRLQGVRNQSPHPIVLEVYLDAEKEKGLGAGSPHFVGRWEFTVSAEETEVQVDLAPAIAAVRAAGKWYSGEQHTLHCFLPKRGYLTFKRVAISGY